MLPAFTEYVDLNRVYVEPPTQLVFVCGGRIDENSYRPQSIRDAFLRIKDNVGLQGSKVLLAERVTTFHISRPAYPDLLTFEIDFAQICELILLFSESQGSIAELGSFAMEHELASKLLVVVRDHHLQGDSFIKLGPLQYLKRHHGEHSVFVLNDDDSGIVGDSLDSLDLDILHQWVGPAVQARLSTVRERTTFNPSRHGHLIKALVGLIQEFGGLTALELRHLMQTFQANIDVDEIDRLLLCAEAAEWIARDQRGFNIFYFALPAQKDALILRFQKGSPVANKLRRRQLLRAYWENNDKLRYSGIVKFAGAAA